MRSPSCHSPLVTRHLCRYARILFMDAKVGMRIDEAIRRRMSAALDPLELVGNTPLLRMRKLTAQVPGVEIYAKAERFNPGGSVKDRPAINSILVGHLS